MFLIPPAAKTRDVLDILSLHMLLQFSMQARGLSWLFDREWDAMGFAPHKTGAK